MHLIQLKFRELFRHWPEAKSDDHDFTINSKLFKLLSIRGFLESLLIEVESFWVSWNYPELLLHVTSLRALQITCAVIEL